MIDEPKSLKNSDERERRNQLLGEKKMGPLVEFVKKIREKKGPDFEIPNFDPLDAGSSAKCLFLLEAPGHKAVESSFVSMDNPDETAKNIFVISQDEVKIPRPDIAFWNVVPWYIGDGVKIRRANSADIDCGFFYLQELLTLMPLLEVIVLLGLQVQRVKSSLESKPEKKYKILVCPHPSPQCINRYPQKRQEIVDTFKEAKKIIN